MAKALDEYLEARREDEITRQIDRVCQDTDTALSPDLASVSRRVLSGAEWND